MTKGKVLSEISQCITEGIKSLTDNYKGSSLTDIYLVVDADNAELYIYDDEENLLSQKNIDLWDTIEDESHIVQQLKNAVQNCDENHLFDSLDVYKPFSVNYADENFLVKEELLLIEDDSIIRIESNFMNKIDKEFDDFLQKLLKE